MKLRLRIILSLIMGLILFFAGGLFLMLRELEEGNALVINPVDLSILEDGVYKGVYKAGRWSNSVEVTVKDHKIVRVDVVKDVLFSKPEVTKKLLDRVIEKQNTDVDVVSGATVTCKAYLKSIEYALTK